MKYLLLLTLFVSCSQTVQRENYEKQKSQLFGYTSEMCYEGAKLFLRDENESIVKEDPILLQVKSDRFEVHIKRLENSCDVTIQAMKGQTPREWNGLFERLDYAITDSAISLL